MGKAVTHLSAVAVMDFGVVDRAQRLVRPDRDYLVVVLTGDG